MKSLIGWATLLIVEVASNNDGDISPSRMIRWP